MFSLSKEEEVFLKKLNSPSKIQDYLDSLSFNFEKNGETNMSPRYVMEMKKAHCFEGALLAAAALMVAGEKPLILSLHVADEDWPHAVTLYKKNGYWGAISKTNHAVLRFRDPIYKTVRELAVSYFHEYFLAKNGEKTLRAYSRPINLKRFGTDWVTTSKSLSCITVAISKTKHQALIPRGNEIYVRVASPLERKASSIPEWKK